MKFTLDAKFIEGWYISITTSVFRVILGLATNIWQKFPFFSCPAIDKLPKKVTFRSAGKLMLHPRSTKDVILAKNS